MPNLRLAGLAVLLAACASTSPSPRPVTPSASAISRDELKTVIATDMLEAIMTIRPHWVRRPGERHLVDVYLQDSRIGGVLELRSYHPTQVESVEYLTAGQAEFRLHQSRGRPVIILEPREL